MPKHYWPEEARTRHLYIAGRSGYGKSTTMFSLALNDITSGRAVIVIDPKGDLVAGPPDRDGNEPGGLLYHIPTEHRDRCFFISPKTPVPMDFMSWREGSESEIEFARDDIVNMFHRLDPNWGVRMGALLNYAVLTLLLLHRTDFMEIHKILVNNEWRDSLIQQIRASSTIHPSLRETVLTFWEKEFDKLPKDAKSPITFSRMADFLLSPSLLKFLGAGNQLNIQEIIENNKVLLVSLGAVGSVTSTAMILGSMLVSKIQQALFRREGTPKSHRRPFSLFVDEFQNFRSTAFSTILSQARAFNLSACLANQQPKQIAELLDDIKGCISTFLFFRMDADHAGIFRSEILSGEEADPYQAIRTGIENHIRNLELDKQTERERLSHLPPNDEGWRDSDWLRTIYYKISDLKQRLKLLPAPSNRVSLSDFSTLPVGRAFYSAADGTRTFINTPGPPDFPSPELVQNAEYIRKRTIDTYPCNTPPVWFNERDEHRTPSDDVNPTGPTVPPHHGKTKNP
jgi:hypothetical protein